jgi:hypothetical protein
VWSVCWDQRSRRPVGYLQQLAEALTSQSGEHLNSAPPAPPRSVRQQISERALILPTWGKLVGGDSLIPWSASGVSKRDVYLGRQRRRTVGRRPGAGSVPDGGPADGRTNSPEFLDRQRPGLRVKGNIRERSASTEAGRRVRLASNPVLPRESVSVTIHQSPLTLASGSSSIAATHAAVISHRAARLSRGRRDLVTGSFCRRCASPPSASSPY